MKGMLKLCESYFAILSNLLRVLKSHSGIISYLNTIEVDTCIAVNTCTVIFTGKTI